IRQERGPGLLMIQSSGTTGYLRIEAYKFAKLGYCTIMPDLYNMLGFAELSGTLAGKEEVQEVRTDEEFVRAIDVGWRYLAKRPAFGVASISIRQPRVCLAGIGRGLSARTCRTGMATRY